MPPGARNFSRQLIDLSQHASVRPLKDATRRRVNHGPTPLDDNGISEAHAHRDGIIRLVNAENATTAVPAGCPYVIEAEIGQGGMAIVYRAHLTGGGPQVALKLPRPIAPQGQERMRREVDVQSQLRHDGIMPILDHYDGGAGEPWFTMPLADSNLKDARATIRESEVQPLITGLAEALSYAHGQGYLHRDISPRNILLLNGKRWVVADWGVVRRAVGDTTSHLTTTSGGFGTFGFAAPEMQVASPHAANESADVYSLGRIAAWLVTGQEPVPNVALLPAGQWRGVLAQATHNDPSRRCQTMRAFLDLMEDLLGELPGTELDRLAEDLEGVSWSPRPRDPIWARVESHQDDPDAMFDVVSRISESAVRAWVNASPLVGAAVAIRMAEHLVSADWGRRNFNDANESLGWVFSAMRGLVDSTAMNELEDIATAFFIASEHWNRFAQNDRTASWLRAITGPAAEAVALALRRSGTAAFHAGLLRSVTPDSAVLARVLNGGRSST